MLVAKMPQRTPRSREGRATRQPPVAADIVSVEEETVDASVEEQRQIRAALAEYFSILQEWSRTKAEDATPERPL